MSKCFLIVALLLASGSPAAPNCTDDEGVSESPNHLKIGPFIYQTTYNPDTDRGQFRLLRQGKVAYRQWGSHFFINPNSKCGGIPAGGNSITGRHRKELAVVDWTGGAHCCYALSIVALEDQPFLVQRIDLGHSWPEFKDLDGDGASEILLSDWTFAYWKTSFAQSPSPQITLSYNGKNWIYDPRWNTQSRPSPSDLFEIRTRIQEAFVEVKSDASLGDYNETGAPVLLWKEALNLIYSGSANLAYELIDSVWPQANPHKKKFLCQFRDQLRQSPFFESVKKSNRPEDFWFRKDRLCKGLEAGSPTHPRGDAWPITPQ